VTCHLHFQFANKSDAVHNILNLTSFIMFLWGLLLFSGVSAQNQSCITEAYIDYNERDIVEPVTLETPQACAEHCASIEGGLFWTYSLNEKTCHVKNSAHNSRRGIMYTVSGNRACGLRDFEVRVTDTLPPSGEEMFREGVLLGSYVGASVVWQKITVESRASGPLPEGRYVLLQKDDNNHRLEVIEFEAFGGNGVKWKLAPIVLAVTLLLLLF